MTVIQASSGTYRSRVDGTIVLSVEIEPRFRAEALALFGMPGTPLALAALRDGFQAVQDAPKEKIGPLCLLAVQWCKSDDFQAWARVENEDEAAYFIRSTCSVKSRRDLDVGEIAGATFQREIRGPFMQWGGERMA